MYIDIRKKYIGPDIFRDFYLWLVFRVFHAFWSPFV